MRQLNLPGSLDNTDCSLGQWILTQVVNNLLPTYTKDIYFFIMSAWKPTSNKTFSFRKFPQSWICSHFNKLSVKRYFWNRNILYSITQIHKVRKFNVRDKAAKECRQWQGHIRSWGMRVTRSYVKRSETPNTTGTVLSVKVVPKVFRGNRWAKCL